MEKYIIDASTTRARIVEKYVILGVRYFFGGHALISGANHYLLIIPDVIPHGTDIVGRFMAVLVESHLYDVVKVIEIVCGLSLLSGLFMPVALMMEMPVTVIIFFLSVFMNPTPRTLFTGTREVIENAFLLTTYWGYFKPVIWRLRAPPKPFWRKHSGSEFSERSP